MALTPLALVAFVGATLIAAPGPAVAAEDTLQVGSCPTPLVLHRGGAWAELSRSALARDSFGPIDFLARFSNDDLQVEVANMSMADESQGHITDDFFDVIRAGFVEKAPTKTDAEWLADSRDGASALLGLGAVITGAHLAKVINESVSVGMLLDITYSEADGRMGSMVVGQLWAMASKCLVGLAIAARETTSADLAPSLSDLTFRQ